MKTAHVISALLSLFVSMPIWFYLIYQMLVRVNASELMWFLFWIYVPVSFIASVVTRSIDNAKALAKN
jgi:hypothetical protein